MIITDKIEATRQTRWQNAASTWGLVPTMGALHEGHLELVRQARQNNDYTAVSIFINPKQFAANEDLDSYPRDLDADLALLEKEGVDLVFTPTPKIMYPDGFLTQVKVTKLPTKLEGSTRPTHFDGVTVVVCKLFNIFQPTRAYFGQKDAQQTIILKRMAADLNLNLDLVVCPTVRASDGLALSSRNLYLSAEQRQAAPVLYQALNNAKDAYQAGTTNTAELRQLMQNTISQTPLAQIDYISIADSKTLDEADQITGPTLISLAVYFGKTRLIDNLVLGD